MEYKKKLKNTGNLLNKYPTLDEANNIFLRDEQGTNQGAKVHFKAFRTLAIQFI